MAVGLPKRRDAIERAEHSPWRHFANPSLIDVELPNARCASSGGKPPASCSAASSSRSDSSSRSEFRSSSFLATTFHPSSVRRHSTQFAANRVAGLLWGGPPGPRGSPGPALSEACKFFTTERADGGVGRGPEGPPHPVATSTYRLEASNPLVRSVRGEQRWYAGRLPRGSQAPGQPPPSFPSRRYSTCRALLRFPP